jgi:hypothetical protein
MRFDWLWGKKKSDEVKNLEIEKEVEYHPPKQEHATELWRYKIIGTVEDVALSPDGSYVVAGTDISGSWGMKEWPEIFFFNKTGELLWKRDLDAFYLGARYYGLKSVFLGGSIIAEMCGNPLPIQSTVRSVRHHFNRDGTYEDYYPDSKAYGEWKYSKDESGKKRIFKDGSYVEMSNVNGGVSLFNKEKKHLWDFNPCGRVTCAAVSSDAPYMAIGCEFGKQPHMEDYVKLYLLKM